LILYLDTSALVKLYSDEAGTAEVQKAVGRSELVAASLIAYVEMRSALARKRRLGEITETAFVEYKREFDRDWETIHRLSLDDVTVHRAGAFAEQYGLRAYDGVHLATAESLQLSLRSQVSFACFDKSLNAAAQQLGLNLL